MDTAASAVVKVASAVVVAVAAVSAASAVAVVAVLVVAAAAVASAVSVGKSDMVLQRKDIKILLEHRLYYYMILLLCLIGLGIYDCLKK